MCHFWTVQINMNVACFVVMRDDEYLSYNLDNYFDSALENDFEALWLRDMLTVGTAGFHYCLLELI